MYVPTLCIYMHMHIEAHVEAYFTFLISFRVNGHESKVECVVTSGGCGLEMVPPTL